MTNNRRNLLTTVLAAVGAMLTVSMATAATFSVNVPTTTFTISQLGDVTLVFKEGVPEAIVATGQQFTGMGVGTDINGMANPGDVLLSSNLKLLPGTMPLTFDHDGYVNFTIGGDMLSLKYTGKATKTKDLVMMTKTLCSFGDFVVANGMGVTTHLPNEPALKMDGAQACYPYPIVRLCVLVGRVGRR